MSQPRPRDEMDELNMSSPRAKAPRSSTPALPPPILLPPLPPELLEAWQAELANASSQDARAHYWHEPHWLPLTNGADQDDDPPPDSSLHAHAHARRVDERISADDSCGSSDSEEKSEGLQEQSGDEGLLACTLRHLSQAFSPTEWRELCGAEFWTQQRDLSSPLHLHWDCDEERGRTLHQMRCPVASIILYLSGGGPTLVLDMRPRATHAAAAAATAAASSAGSDADAAALTKGWLVWPHPGQCVLIDGEALHGVLALPTQALPDQATAAQKAIAAQHKAARAFRRHTVIFNFWRRRPRALPKLPLVLKPPAPWLCVAPATRAAHAAVTAAAVVAPNRNDSEACLPLTWAAQERASWRETELTLGQFDRSELLRLKLPPVAYRGHALEAF